ncbi:hypothetical protein ACRAWF_13735 [Streptomyces sp. L7]
MFEVAYDAGKAGGPHCDGRRAGRRVRLRQLAVKAPERHPGERHQNARQHAARSGPVPTRRRGLVGYTQARRRSRCSGAVELRLDERRPSRWCSSTPAWTEQAEAEHWASTRAGAHQVDKVQNEDGAPSRLLGDGRRDAH